MFPYSRYVFIGVFAIFAIALLSCSFYTVDSKERGVLLRYGKVVEVSEPGLHFKMPFADSVKTVSIENQSMNFPGLDAYSKDQQPARMRVSVSYHVSPAQVEELYKGYGSIESLEAKTIGRHVPTQVENVFGQYSATEAVRDRAKLVRDISAAVKEFAKGPLTIDSVQVENIDFSDAYEKAIADRMNAEVAVTTRSKDLEKERINAEIKVTQAKAQADSDLAIATASAAAVRLKGEAEASALLAKAKAIADNPQLVEMMKVEKWHGDVPQQMIPGAAIPFVNVK